MKKVIRKNQVIITSLAILIAIAGYLNFADVDLGFGEKEASTESSSILDQVDYDLSDESAAADENGTGRTQPVSARQKRRHCGGYPARHPALCHAHRVDVRHGGFLHGIFRAGRRHPSESCGVLVLQPSGR